MTLRAIDHDESMFPLVVVTWTGLASDSDFEAFFAAQRKLLARNQPYVQIADATNAKVMSSTHRRMIAEFSEQTSADAARLCKGTTVIISNAIVRGGMTAVLWIAKLSYPIEVAATFDEALAIATRWARGAGLVLPPVASRSHG